MKDLGVVRNDGTRPRSSLGCFRTSELGSRQPDVCCPISFRLFHSLYKTKQKNDEVLRDRPREAPSSSRAALTHHSLANQTSKSKAPIRVRKKTDFSAMKNRDVSLNNHLQYCLRYSANFRLFNMWLACSNCHE